MHSRGAGHSRWLWRLLTSTLPVVVGVTLVVFFLLRLLPGDPAQAILGDRATDASVAALRLKLGLNEPLYQQFLDFVGRLVLHGDIGNSLVYQVPVRDLIVARAGISLGLVALATVFTALLAVPLALLAATHKDGWIDHAVRIVPAVGLGMPLFWVGVVLVLFFSVNLRWLPVGGSDRGIISLLLPAITVAISMVPPVVRSLRIQLLEVLEADFVVTLRSTGLPWGRILTRHVLRNAGLPTLTLFGFNVAFLVGGTLVVERVFAINGLGALMFEAISNRDFPTVQGVALFCALVVVLITSLTDFLATRLDPRTKTP